MESKKKLTHIKDIQAFHPWLFYLWDKPHRKYGNKQEDKGFEMNCCILCKWMDFVNFLAMERAALKLHLIFVGCQKLWWKLLWCPMLLLLWRLEPFFLCEVASHFAVLGMDLLDDEGPYLLMLHHFLFDLHFLELKSPMLLLFAVLWSQLVVLVKKTYCRGPSLKNIYRKYV